MNNKVKIRNIISNIITIVILIVAVIIYKNYDYNYFVKGVKETGKTTFSRDSKLSVQKKEVIK